MTLVCHNTNLFPQIITLLLVQAQGAIVFIFSFEGRMRVRKIALLPTTDNQNHKAKKDNLIFAVSKNKYSVHFQAEAYIFFCEYPLLIAVN